MEQQRTIVQRRVIHTIDVLWLILCTYITNFLCTGKLDKNVFSVNLIFYILIVCMSYLLIKVFVNNKKIFFNRNFYEEFQVVLKCHLLLFGVVAALFLLLKQEIYNFRMALVCYFAISFVLIFGYRCIYKKAIIRHYRKGKAGKRLLIMTTSDRVEKVVESLKKSNMWDFRFTGLILLDSSELGVEYGGLPVVGNFYTMYEYAKADAVDEIFINIPYNSGMSLIPVVEMFESMGITVKVNVQLYDLQIKDRKRDMMDFGDFYVVSFAPEFFDANMMMVKRFMDIVGSLVGLMLTAVISVFVAPALLLESPGPLFFSQTRIGKNGRRFKIYKFRSMYMDAEERKKELMEQNEMNGLMFKMENDPRVTKVGKFIRRTSIDELPQFLNILKGDMSLVGTRPPTVDEFEKYEARHKRRVSIVPGLTGLWQASGRSDITDFEEVVKLDLKYIDEWSIWLDIKIIFQTVLAVLFSKGAK